MRLMFVYWQIENAGSAQTILHYTKIAKTLGHEVVLYAPEDSRSRFNCSLDIESTDVVIFVLEWNLCLHPGGYLNLVRLVSRVPRERRIIIDNDGMYNEIIRVNGDYNHPDPAASRRKIEFI